MSLEIFEVLNQVPQILGGGDLLTLRRAATAVRLDDGSGSAVSLRLAAPAEIGDESIAVESTTATKSKLELPTGLTLGLGAEAPILAAPASATGTSFTLSLSAPLAAAHDDEAAVAFDGYVDIEYALAPGRLVTSMGGTARAGGVDSAISASMIEVGDVKHVISASHGITPRAGDVSFPDGRRVIAVSDHTSRGLWTVWLRGAA